MGEPIISASGVVLADQTGSVRLEDGVSARGGRLPVLRRVDDAPPFGDFLDQVHREKRRSERSRSPLSLALFQLVDKNLRDLQHVDRLLESLYAVKRETDIVGQTSPTVVAVLCPDTDERGTQSLLRKVSHLAGDLPFAMSVATYPNDLFDSLLHGIPLPQVFEPFVAAEAATHPGIGYPLKRTLDVVGTLVALALFGPLMLMVAAAIALTSRGPIIFRQTRIGKGGVPFTFYKFRSMVVNGSDDIHREFVTGLIRKADAGSVAPDGGGPALYKLKADPRVTGVGRFIRKTSLDELPQLFNVLRGEMSLVGPRPPLPYESVQYQSWHLRRILTMKPGITGLWQVEGRSKVSFNEMVRMDLRYIRRCSLATDLWILLKTVAVVLRCDGAV